MTSQTRVINKSKFKDGDTATGSNFSDLIDSFVSLADSAAQNVTSDLRAANLITPGKVSAATLNISTFQASNVSAVNLTSSNLTITASARVAGTFAVTGIVSAADLVFVNTNAALCLTSAGGTSGVVLTTARNPVNLNTITSAGGRIMVRGFVKIRVDGTVACVPFFYSTS